jgi:drug/metabolite transporter (DMT)-like permease
VQHYSANRLAAVTFLTPLFGVAAGHLILDEPLSVRFLAAVAMVTLGALLPHYHALRMAARHARVRLLRRGH